MYKYEIHLHTNGCSACATSTANEMVDAAVKKGYSGFVITNHFYNGNTCVNRKLPYNQFVKAYAEDYYAAKEYGNIKGVNVFFGIEEVYAPGKEMLIYGLEPEILADYSGFIKASPKEKSDFVHKNEGIVICAHPFRDRNYIPHPNDEPDISLFDAIEYYNHFNRPSENQRALDFAKNNNIKVTSGGDVHNSADFGNAGIAFENPINNIAQLTELLKSNKYKLIINGDIT